MVTVPSMTLGRADAILNSSFAQVYILQESFWLEAKELISPGNTRRWLIKMSSRRLFEWGRKEQRKEERKERRKGGLHHNMWTLRARNLMLPIFFHKPEIHCSIETYGVNCSFLFLIFLLFAWWGCRRGRIWWWGLWGWRGGRRRKGMTVPQKIWGG